MPRQNCNSMAVFAVTVYSVFTNEEIKALKAQITRLEKDLDNARIKAELYNEMINVAEQHFNIRIRKKSGAK